MLYMYLDTLIHKYINKYIPPAPTHYLYGESNDLISHLHVVDTTVVQPKHYCLIEPLQTNGMYKLTLQSKYGNSQNDYTLLNWNQYAHVSAK